MYMGGTEGYVGGEGYGGYKVVVIMMMAIVMIIMITSLVYMEIDNMDHDNFELVVSHGFRRWTIKH